MVTTVPPVKRKSTFLGIYLSLKIAGICKNLAGDYTTGMIVTGKREFE
jgi:hypothetical protein